MKAFLKDIVVRTVLNKKNLRRDNNQPFSDLVLAKGFRELKMTLTGMLKDTLLIGAGIFSAAFGLESFLLPNNFIDGGATGVALLLTEISLPYFQSASLSGISPLALFLVAINIPFVWLSYKVISKQFALRTGLAILLLSLVLATVTFPIITHDKLLVAIFGGFFLGAGIGLAVRGGGVLDGTEVLAIFISRKAGTTIGDIIIIVNIFIFSAAAYLLSVEIALYSMVTYLSASKSLDFVIEGIEEYQGVTIVSAHHEKIREMIIHNMGRGVTVYKGKRGYIKDGIERETDIIYTVITRLEISKLYSEIEKIDSNAFVVMNSIKDTKGGMIKKRRHKH